MKSLVIAEKPSVARDIARVLKCGKNINGAIEGDRYVVTWGLGHLVTLADPEDYDKKYKEWKMEDLPMMPDVSATDIQSRLPSIQERTCILPPCPLGEMPWIMAFSTRGCRAKEGTSTSMVSGLQSVS